MRRAGAWRAICLAAAAALWVGCGDGGGEGTGGPAGGAPDSGGSAAGDGGTGAAAGSDAASVDLAALAARGKVVYTTNCIACHHRDPSREGGLGPAVAGSSRELLEARVLRAEYPPGYSPKAETGLMIALPHLEDEIDALAAYLADPGSV